MYNTIKGRIVVFTLSNNEPSISKWGACPLLNGGRHIAPPRFYRSPEWTNRSREDAFYFVLTTISAVLLVNYDVSFYGQNNWMQFINLWRGLITWPLADCVVDSFKYLQAPYRPRSGRCIASDTSFAKQGQRGAIGLRCFIGAYSKTNTKAPSSDMGYGWSSDGRYT